MRALIALLLATMLVAIAPLAGADAPHHDAGTDEFDIRWNCPGKNPREHATVTSRETEFSRDGDRVRVLVHVRWRGWITHRDTGELIRDEGRWNETYHYRGRELLKRVITGAIWRLVIPGHGIVMHQTGRRATIDGEDVFATPFSAEPSFDDGLCRYV